MIELVTIPDKHKESLIRILNKDEVQKWLANPPFPYTEQDANEFIERNQDLNKKQVQEFLQKTESHIIQNIFLRII